MGMAVCSYAVVVDGADVTRRKPISGRAAGIWYSSDGYDPVGKGINGRRMAGESFLRGFMRHADVDELVGLAHGSGELEQFAKLAGSERPDLPNRGVRLDQMQNLAPVGNLFFSAPGLAPEIWRRGPLGHDRYSICGITHTTATKAVMEQVWALRMAPQMEWDAIICTSRAVQAAILVQMDLIDAQMRHRFGHVPPRPQLPVIPLGVHCADFRPDAVAGAALRTRLGVGVGDVLCLTVARLSPHGKFDPLPLYLALAEAHRAMPGGPKLHMVVCGTFSDSYSRDVFVHGASGLMPDVPFHHIDKADDALRLASLSGADVFMFPIDNLQEAFGIAPVEAMAAGLPVVASDWDGLRDTVTADTGILIPTEAIRPALTQISGLRYLGGTDNFNQYLTQASAMTRIDVGGMARAIVALASDPQLRRRLGDAGQRRARELFDWGRVIPKMQDLWGELSARRATADPERARAIPATEIPVGPTPTRLFASYPTRQFDPGQQRYRASDLDQRMGVLDTFALRNYARLGRLFELPEHVDHVFNVMATAGRKGLTLGDITAASGYGAGRVERILLWLLKYHFACEAGDD